MTLLIKNGIIHDAVSPKAYRADILAENGRIVKIGNDIELPHGAEIYNADGLDVYPGFVDAHTHIGMFGTSGAATKDDVELNAILAPEHRGIDAINPLEPTFRQAREAGVTCVCVGPGSISAIAGTHLALKTYGYRLSEMVVKDPVAMKAALGENPKSRLKDVSTRMTLLAAIRDTILRAKQYKAKKDAAVESTKMPTYDPKCEALLPVVEKKIPLKVHVYRVDDLQSIMRLAQECDIRLTLEHATDAHLLADEIVATGIPVAVGPYFSQSRKQENENKHPKYAVELIRAGVCVSVMTDSPAVAEEYLPLSAGLLMREGLDEFEALKTITANPAKHLGIEDRVGTIRVGCDADFVISRGCPLLMTVKPEAVFIDGKCVYEH